MNSKQNNSSAKKQPTARLTYDYQSPAQMTGRANGKKRVVFDYSNPTQVKEIPREKTLNIQPPSPSTATPLFSGVTPMRERETFDIDVPTFTPPPRKMPPSPPPQRPAPPLIQTQSASQNKGAQRAKTAPPKPAPPKAALQKQPKAKPPVDYETARKRRKWRKIILTALATVVIIAGVIASVRVIFKIETISVSGESIYQLEEILSALPVKNGDNLFSFNTAKTLAAVQEALPYLGSVTIARKLPSTIQVAVVNAVETYNVNTGDGWAVLDEKFRVLRVTAEPPSGCVMILGVDVAHAKAGQMVAFDDAEKLAAFTAICAALTARELAAVGEIDLSNILDMTVLYDNRIRINLGTVNEMDAKVEWAKYLLTNQEAGKEYIGAEERGTLDVSARNDEGRIKGAFLPETT